MNGIISRRTKTRPEWQLESIRGVVIPRNQIFYLDYLTWKGCPRRRSRWTDHSALRCLDLHLGLPNGVVVWSDGVDLSRADVLDVRGLAACRHATPSSAVERLLLEKSDEVRAARPGEPSEHRESASGEETYADIALVSNLGGTGTVLILNGIDMAAAESAEAMNGSLSML
jgi:hypothetical protein